MRSDPVRKRNLAISGGAVLVLVVLLYGFSDELATRLSTTAAPSVVSIDVESENSAALHGTAEIAGELDREGDTEPLANMPPPFLERRFDFPAEGEEPPSETASYCADANWSRMELLVGRSDSGAFRVDEAAWDRALTGSKAGLASWMSQCHESGAAIEIVAAESGRKLATYDPQSGFTTLQ